MRKTTLAAAGVLLLLALQQAAGQAKIGYVDSQKIRKQFGETAEAERQLREANQVWEKELGEKKSSLENLQRELEEQSLLLSEERIKEKKQEIETVRQELQAYQKQKWGEGGEYTRKQEELFAPVFQKIKRAIDQVSEEEGLDIVFDTVQGNIVYAREQMDITDKVIELLKKEDTRPEGQQERR